MRIRLARADEAERLRAIEDSAARLFLGMPHAYAAEHPPHPAAVYADLAEGGLILMALWGDEPIGFAACESFPDALHLKELAVAHEHQRRGAGRALVDAVAELARSRGLQAVTLTTFQDLAWNGPWYARLGFQELARGTAGARLEDELAADAERGLASRCAMRLELPAAP